MRLKSLKETYYAVMSRNARTLNGAELFRTKKAAMSYRVKGESVAKVHISAEKIPVERISKSLNA